MAAPVKDHCEAACLIKQDDESPQLNLNEAFHQQMPLEVGEASSHKDHPKQRITFRDLPAEIRNMVWNAALVPRVVLIKPKDRATETDSPNKVDFNKIPGMLFVNRESRLIALRHYDQRFTLTFFKRVPAQADGSTQRLMCRIPVIMSTIDQLAFSRPQLRAEITTFDHVSISIDAATGAPEPQIGRISLLGDSLVRPGINTEDLARLLDPMAPEWESTIDESGIFTSRYIDWRPFSRCPDLGVSGRDSKAVETLCIKFKFSFSAGLQEWFRSGLDSWCRREIYFLDVGVMDACVLDLGWTYGLLD